MWTLIYHECEGLYFYYDNHLYFKDEFNQEFGYKCVTGDEKDAGEWVLMRNAWENKGC